MEPQKQIAVQLLMVKEDTATRSGTELGCMCNLLPLCEGNHPSVQDSWPEKGICNICTYLRIPRNTNRVSLDYDVH